MKRIPCLPRSGWQLEVEALGLTWHTHRDGTLYWDEGVCYVFSEEEILRIEQVTQDLHELCLQAAGHVVAHNRFAELGVPAKAIPLIVRSWEERTPSLYGRFDLAYGGSGDPKMLEYNADTPTSLVEAAVVQYYWMRAQKPDADQFNSLWEAIVARLSEIRASQMQPGETLFLTYSGGEFSEDHMTVATLQEAAKEAGITTQGVHVSGIAYDQSRSIFVSTHDQPMRTVYKLYPWEWMWKEPSAAYLPESYGHMYWIEPYWKMILSSKGILPLLWELFPGHPNLLEAHFGSPGSMTNYVRKPLYSREGANVSIVRGGRVVHESLGTYATGDWIYQELAELPDFDGYHPVLGSWIVGDMPHGMGIRESQGLVTDNLSRFIPHIFEG